MSKITKDDLLTYVSDLGRKKVKCIGQGAYAHVYAHPTDKDKVVKVFSPSEDPAYRYFIRWCMKNQHNPYVPKIFGYHEFDHQNENGKISKREIGIVFLERLKSISVKKYNKLAYSFVNHCNELEDVLCTCRICIRSGLFLESFEASHWKKISNSTKDKHLRDFAKFMHRASKNFENDCHDDNVMLRGKQIVFTDAICC